MEPLQAKLSVAAPETAEAEFMYMPGGIREISATNMLNRKLAALLTITDPQLFLSRAADLKGWLEANAAHFADNPAAQQVLEQTLSAGLANGLASKSKPQSP
jgi:hypothetical protein